MFFSRLFDRAGRPILCQHRVDNNFVLCKIFIWLDDGWEAREEKAGMGQVLLHEEGFCHVVLSRASSGGWCWWRRAFWVHGKYIGVLFGDLHGVDRASEAEMCFRRTATVPA